jgi:hypothetical protein
LRCGLGTVRVVAVRKMSELPDFEELEQDWDPTKLSFIDHMIAGSFAGLAEHVAMFPLDTLKTNVQCEKCGSNSPLQTINCAKKIIKQDGVFRLWRGVSAMFIGCVPAHAAYFSIYEQMKVLLGVDGQVPSHSCLSYPLSHALSLSLCL